MGLTIHYQLTTCRREPAEVRQLVARLRHGAFELPFERVGKLLEVVGLANDLEQQAATAPERWLLTQVAATADAESAQTPLHVIAFATLPGQGCEPASFGFVRRLVTAEAPHSTSGDDQPESPWRWAGFCKTGGAGHPDCGGGANFIKCHALVLRLLERACSLEIETEVFDEAGLWRPGDVRQFIATVGRWNRALGAALGRLGDLTLAEAWDELERALDVSPEACPDLIAERFAG